MLLVLMINWFQLSINAQDVKIEWGKPKEANSKTIPIKFLGISDGFIYLLTSEEVRFKNMVIEKYDEKTNTLISATELQFKLNLPRVYLLNGQLVTIDCEATKTKSSFYVTPITPTGELSPDKKLLTEFDLNPDENSYDYYNWVSSEDTKQILLYHQHVKEKKLEYAIVDEKLNVTKGSFKYESESNLILQLNYFGHKDFVFLNERDHKPQNVIFNNSAIYMLFAELKPKDEQIKTVDISNLDAERIVNYNYSLLIYNKDGKSVKPIKLDFKKENHLLSTYLRLDENNNIIITGTYQEKDNNYNNTKGFYCVRIDTKTNTIISKLEYDYPKEFATNFISEKQYDKKYGVPFFTLRDFVTKEDGGILLVTENYIKREMGSDNAWVYFPKEIVIISINKNGQEEWIKVIPKNQLGDMRDNGLHVSFVTAYSKNNLYLIYNDYPENMNIKEESKLKSEYKKLKGTVTAMVTMNCKDGSWEKKILFDYKSDAFYLTPQQYYKLNKNEIIIHGQNDKTEVLGRLKY